MNRLRTPLLVLAGLLLVGLLLWLLRPSGTAAVTDNPALTSADTSPGALQPETALAAPEAAALVERTAADPIVKPAPAPSAPDKTRLVFRGRCVAAESGAPLAGCTVNFYGWEGNSTLIAKYGEPDWKEVEPFVTGADGVFVFDVPETLPYQFALNCHAPGRLGRSDRYDTEIPGGTQHDLGDVPLQRGAEVTGIVRDEVGAPVEEISVLFENLPMEIRPGQAAGDSVGAASASDGSFKLQDALPAGTWPIRLYADTCTLVGPQAVTIEAGLAPSFVEVRVRHSPSIAGVILDENGMPAPRASVQTVRNTGGRMEHDWTDAKGEFRIYRQRDSEEPVLLEVDGGGLEPTRSDGTFAWGTSGIRLQARRLLSIQILVREKGSGVPIEDFALRCHGTDANSSTQTDLRLGGTHPGGSLTVGEVAYGENVLLVIPKDTALLPNAPLMFSAPLQQEEPLVVELERMVPLRLRIVSSQGSPLPGSTAALLEKEVSEHSRLRTIDPRGGTSSIGWHRFQSGPVLWSSGVAGENGEIQLYLPAEQPLAVVAVEGAHPRHMQEIVRPLDLPQPLVITVPLGASVRGKLIHPLSGSGKVGILAIPEERRSFGDDPWMPGADGTFEGHGLVAGTYSFILAVRVDYEDSRGGGSGGWIELQPPLAQLVLAADEAREVLLDASAFAFGTVNGHLEIPDPSVSELKLDLILMPPPGEESKRGGGGIGRFGEYVADAGRNFRAEQIPPGSYAAAARWKSADGVSRSLRSRNRIELPPGGNASGSFEFVRLRLRFGVLDSGGKPLAGVRVQERSWTAEDAPFVVSDSDGWVEFDWVNAGRLEPRVLMDPPRFLTPVEVLADQDVTVVEARALTREERAAERAAGKGGG